MVLSARAASLLCTKPPYPVAPLLSDQLIGVAKAHAEHRLKNLVAECRSKALDIPSVDTPCALHSRTGKLDIRQKTAAVCAYVWQDPRITRRSEPRTPRGESQRDNVGPRTPSHANSRARRVFEFGDEAAPPLVANVQPAVLRRDARAAEPLTSVLAEAAAERAQQRVAQPPLREGEAALLGEVVVPHLISDELGSSREEPRSS